MSVVFVKKKTCIPGCLFHFFVTVSLSVRFVFWSFFLSFSIFQHLHLSYVGLIIKRYHHHHHVISTDGSLPRNYKHAQLNVCVRNTSNACNVNDFAKADTNPVDNGRSTAEKWSTIAVFDTISAVTSQQSSPLPRYYHIFHFCYCGFPAVTAVLVLGPFCRLPAASPGGG